MTLQIEIAGKYAYPGPWFRLRRRSASWTPAITVFLPFAAGYFLSYWIRTVNGPLADGLVNAFSLGPRDLGLLISLYFLAFAAFQIPVGLLLDRYGPRRVQTALALIATAGIFVFATAQGWGMLMLGRALIGLGCSGALVSGIKALALWLPPERKAIGNCGLVMCGGLGALASAAPLGAVVDVDHWRAVFVALGFATLAVAGLVWSLAPDIVATPYGAALAPPDMAEVRLGFARVVRDRRFWRVAPLSAAVVGAAFAVHGLWAARWLADVPRALPDDIAAVLLTMGAGLTFGAATFGLLATWLARFGVTTTRLFGWTCAAFLGIEVMLASDPPIPPAILLGALAMFGGITVLSFTIMGELFPPNMVGRANGALNTLHLGAAFMTQAGIGAVVSLWPVSASSHAPQVAYACAFGLLVTIQAVALAWFAGTPAGWPRSRPMLAWSASDPATAIDEAQP